MLACGGQWHSRLPELAASIRVLPGANQSRVKPPALVSTVTPPIFAVFRAVPDEAGLDAAVAALTACYSRRRSSQMSLRTRQQSMGRRPARPTPAICYASNFPSPGDWLT